LQKFFAFCKTGKNQFSNHLYTERGFFSLH
jgi:hypothetical protein